MAINTSKVVVGGLAAGVVANVIGYLGFGVMLGQRMNAEAVAVAPALQGRGMSSGAITTNVIASFVVGILLVWLYAAIRPRFGPGLMTATYAGLVVWVLAFLFHLDWLVVGLMSTATYALAALIGLVQTLVPAWVGAWIYKEPETVG